MVEHGKVAATCMLAAAHVAKRTVYLHFENKAAVFLAIVEYLGARCNSDALAPRARAARLSTG